MHLLFCLLSIWISICNSEILYSTSTISCPREFTSIPFRNTSLMTTCNSVSLLTFQSISEPSLQQSIPNLISIQASTPKSTIDLHLKKFKTVYNSYEYFEENANCAISIGIGKCSGEDAMDKPIVENSNSNADAFALCCLQRHFPPLDPQLRKFSTENKRKAGTHCLKTKREEKYTLYTLETVVPHLHQIQYTLTTFKNNITKQFILSSSQPSLTIPLFGEAKMTTFVQLPLFESGFYVLDQRKINTLQDTNVAKWFFIPFVGLDQNRLGITAEQWKNLVSCNSENLVKTHSVPHFEQDQFYLYRNQSILEIYQRELRTQNARMMKQSDDDDKYVLRLESDFFVPVTITVAIQVYDSF